MKLRPNVYCSKCEKPIVSGANWGFVCFKIPGKEGYQFFHCRRCGGDCWESYLSNPNENVTHKESETWAPL